MIRCRFFLEEIQEPIVVTMDIEKVNAFIDLLKQIDHLTAGDGSFFHVDSVEYDIQQHAIDFACAKDEPEEG